jgi:RND family efflux transporter MFP subunit
VFAIGRDDSPGMAEGAQGLIAVHTAAVVRDSVGVGICAVGQVVSAATVPLSFATAGYVRFVREVSDGDLAQGTILAALDTVQSAATLRKAQSAHDKCMRDLQRVEALYADSVATLEQVQNARSALSIAQEDEYLARYTLEHSTVRAPGTGRLLQMLVEQHQMVGPGTPVCLFGLGQARRAVEVALSESDVAQLQLGDAVQVQLQGVTTQLFSGVVTQIAQAPSGPGGLYRVEVVAQGAFEGVREGFTAQVTLWPSQRRGWVFVPVESLVRVEGGWGTVYSLDSTGVVKEHRVGVAGYKPGLIAIASGLSDVGRVISAGAAWVEPGMRVRIVETTLHQ